VAPAAEGHEHRLLRNVVADLGAGKGAGESTRTGELPPVELHERLAIPVSGTDFEDVLCQKPGRSLLEAWPVHTHTVLSLSDPYRFTRRSRIAVTLRSFAEDSGRCRWHLLGITVMILLRPRPWKRKSWSYCQSWPFWLALTVIVGSVAIIWMAGIWLSNYTDILSTRYHL
jgi:hypothetical protein